MNSIKTDNSTDKHALEVLEILDRWDERLQGHHAQMRTSERKKYRRKIVVIIPECNQEDDQSHQPQSLAVWCRNLSQGGLSFIHSHKLHEGDILLCLNPDCESKLLYNAQITRSRQVHNGFWEYGVKLLSKVELEKSSAEESTSGDQTA